MATTSRTTDAGLAILRGLVAVRNLRVTLEQLAARLSMPWGQFSDEWARIKLSAGTDYPSRVTKWWLENGGREDEETQRRLKRRY